jgi:hypothetical protein
MGQLGILVETHCFEPIASGPLLKLTDPYLF